MGSTVQDFFNTYSEADITFKSLVGAAVTGPGNAWLSSKPRRIVSMQVSYPAGPSAVKVFLEGTIDGVNWFPLATFDTGASGASGDIVTSTTHAVVGVRANLDTLTGGGFVTATITGTSLGS